MAIKLITAATTNAITTSEAKSHLRVDSSDDDTYVGTLIVAAQRQVEAFTNLKLNDTVYELHLSKFPKHEIVLPFSPLKTLTSITYYDGDNSLQTWSASKYYYSINEHPSVISYVDDIPKYINIVKMRL